MSSLCTRKWIVHREHRNTGLGRTMGQGTGDTQTIHVLYGRPKRNSTYFPHKIAGVSPYNQVSAVGSGFSTAFYTSNSCKTMSEIIYPLGHLVQALREANKDVFVHLRRHDFARLDQEVPEIIFA